MQFFAAPAPAEASEQICAGQLVQPDCQSVTSPPWPPLSNPLTFTAMCRWCRMSQIGPDAGVVPSCDPDRPAEEAQFVISGGPGDAGPRMNIAADFERAGSCGDQALFRYRGAPLDPGVYELRLNSNPHSDELSFTVDRTSPSGDASPSDDASPSGDASPSDAGVRVNPGSGGGGGGCACAAPLSPASGEGRSTRVPLLSLLLVSLVIAPRLSAGRQR